MKWYINEISYCEAFSRTDEKRVRLMFTRVDFFRIEKKKTMGISCTYTPYSVGWFFSR